MYKCEQLKKRKKKKNPTSLPTVRTSYTKTGKLIRFESECFNQK